MFNEYQAEAIEFLNNNDATMSIDFREEVFSPWNDGQWHNAYDVTIERNGEKMTVDFKDSAYNRTNGVEPNEYDILACLQKYEVGEYWDFCDMFGYDNSKESYETYLAVKDEYADVERLFGDCLDALAEIQ